MENNTNIEFNEQAIKEKEKRLKELRKMIGRKDITDPQQQARIMEEYRTLLNEVMDLTVFESGGRIKQ